MTLVALLLLAQAGAQPVDFKRDIAPILVRCQACHGTQMQLGGLRLDSRAAALTGGYSGPALQPGASAASKLIHMVAETKKGVFMPPAGPRLTAPQIALLRAWIDQGAKWPEAIPPISGVRAPAAGSQHWSFITPKRPALPAVRNSAWVRNPIDSFILARLEAEKVAPSPEAERATLIRRLSLDLTGLPPAPGEVTAFLADSRPDAYQRLVDRLLASPHYGEKWARHWLDLGRYADSDGYEKDTARPHAWRYRHWLIGALNRDMPFDQFTLETMAGDLLPAAGVDQKIATGFHRNTLTNREGGVSREQFRFEQVLDRASTLGSVWLGLTVGCAQCHDHKYDPISQKEFYQLFAFFDRAEEEMIPAPLPGESGPHLQALPAYEKQKRELLIEYKIPELQAEWESTLRHTSVNPGKSNEWDFALGVLRVLVDHADKLLELGPERRTQRQNEAITAQFIARYGDVVGKERIKELKIDELQKKLSQLNASLPELSQAPIIAELTEPVKTHIRLRGDYREKGIEVQPGTPAVLPPLSANDPPSRAILARWLTSRDNPLTARVTVNRMWQELFGRGLVRTSEDFGRQGEPPSHPELLDWMAVEFQARGWSMKQMHKLIVESATYRQSSKVRQELVSRDPSNVWLARQSRLRLPAELIRDGALAAGGLLNTAIGGKSVRPPQPAGVADLAYANSVKWVDSTGPDRYRRGLYIHFQRTTPYPQLMNFDAPDSNVACSRRQRSNTPLQALNLLNDPVFFEAAQGMAMRLLRERAGSNTDRINYGFQLALARDATPQERDRLAGYFDRQKSIFASDEKSAGTVFPWNLENVEPVEAAAWVAVARTLLNLDEFITRE